MGRVHLFDVVRVAMRAAMAATEAVAAGQPETMDMGTGAIGADGPEAPAMDWSDLKNGDWPLTVDLPTEVMLVKQAMVAAHCSRPIGALANVLANPMVQEASACGAFHHLLQSGCKQAVVEGMLACALADC